MGHSIKVYGEAIYSLAHDEGASGQILYELKTLSTAFEQAQDFITLLSTPSITKQERCHILDESFRDKVHPYTLNFLKLLTEHGYSPDYLKMSYHCPICKDTGFLPDTRKKCRCFIEAQTKLLFEQSGIYDLITAQNFDTLSFDYFS